MVSERDSLAQLNLAFLGCGFATRLHSKTLSGFKRDFRRYYASRDGDKAAAYNRKYRGSGYFDSYDAAIADDKIEVVLVATPPAYHLDLTLEAMRAGKHVIVEKPAFLRAADFVDIRQAQVETGRYVFVAENYFYKPLAFKLRELIRAGLIGEVLFVHVNAIKRQTTDDWRGDPVLAGGGALFEGGIHWINFVANLGLTVESIRGYRTGAREGSDRSMLVAIEYSEGAVGTLYYSWEIPSLFKGLRISRIFGRKGSITFESNGLFILVNGVHKRVIIPKLTDVAGYKTMFRDFVRALKEGKEPQMNLDLAQRDLDLIETIYQSI
jgi:predicted dehydrogenase